MGDAITMIPLSKLVPSERNVRRTSAGAGIEELAASIEAHGLLQNLTVQPVLKHTGKRVGTFEVIAGGRRLAALNLLTERERLPKSFAVPCRILGDDNPTEVSLAENIVRAPIHPADQFVAFATLQKDGLGAEAIAARFGISPNTVLQRLKLAAVSPKLFEIYRTGEMTLEQLMAFTISDDHEAQEHVWFESPYHGQEPQGIRRSLTRALVEGHDRRARFIGAEAYEAAGGTVTRDLFLTEDAGYFTDSTLLDRLVVEKLAQAADNLRAEGWEWVEVHPNVDYTHLARFGRILPIERPRSNEEEQKLEELAGRYDALVEEHGDDPSEEAAAELERLSAEIDAIGAGQPEWAAEEKARAGAIVSLDFHGQLQVERGLFRQDAATRETRSINVGEPTEQEPEKVLAQEQPQDRATLPDTLVEELTAHRTMALQEVLAGKPDLALTALLFALVLRTFYGVQRDCCVDVRPIVADLRPSAETIGESRAAAAIGARHESLARQIPSDPMALWQMLVGQSLDAKLELLAYCTARTVNAVKKRHGGEHTVRLIQADIIAEAVTLDLAAWWQPTRESYLGRVSKAQILAAVAEAVSPQAAENITGMKKDAMASRAEELLTGTRWLPSVLRSRESPEDPAAANEAA